ncbi:MAG TPA: hypothetical protein PLV68_12210, partial [Ilumatobacteraceae bacterium]|nr:hypothetical protein [Ilumatobacteraceae bacterium]
TTSSTAPIETLGTVAPDDDGDGGSGLALAIGAGLVAVGLAGGIAVWRHRRRPAAPGLIPDSADDPPLD